MITAVFPVPELPINRTGLFLITCLSNRYLSLVVCNVPTYILENVKSSLVWYGETYPYHYYQVDLIGSQK